MSFEAPPPPIGPNSSYEDKLAHARDIISDWYNHHKGQVYVAFSGGKDSTVLLHMVRDPDQGYPDVVAHFCDTGLEYPEIVKFVKTFDNVTISKPKTKFPTVLKSMGIPLGSKKISFQIRVLQHPTENNFKTRRLALIGFTTATGKFNDLAKVSARWLPMAWSDVKLTEQCCDKLKKEPARKFSKENGKYAYVGMTLGEGSTRDTQLLRRKCNVFEGKNQTSVPMKFFTQEDVQRYIQENNIEICSVYKDLNLTRTGCTFCAFGAHLAKDEDNRFAKMKDSHLVQYNIFINKLGMGKALDVAGVYYGNESEEDREPRAQLPNYTCQGCGESFPVSKIGFIDEKKIWTEEEKAHPNPLAGMMLWCKDCCVKRGKPWDSYHEDKKAKAKKAKEKTPDAN